MRNWLRRLFRRRRKPTPPREFCLYCLAERPQHHDAWCPRWGESW